MQQANTQSRLYCSHYIPSDVDCSDCHSIEKDYANRPLYAPLYVPLPNLPNVLDNAQLKLPPSFYVPLNESSNSRKSKNNSSTYFLTDDCIEINTKNGLVRVPKSTLVCMNETNKHNNQCSTGNSISNSQPIFPDDFQKHAHRFTRSFSWKTKPEESPFVQMQPLPKLIKQPGYIEICCKNICWPTHQLCLCCTRNIADSCRKWSKSTGEYDYIDACWSSCALCSDDAYRILNTPVVYNEKIIDPEYLLPLDAELLYYSIQAAKRQQAKSKNNSSELLKTRQESEKSDDKIPFNQTDKTPNEETILSKNPDIHVEPVVVDPLPSVTTVPPTTTTTKVVEKPKPLRKTRSSKSIRSKKHRKKSSSKRSKRTKSRSKRKSKSKK